MQVNKLLEAKEMRTWHRMVKISWTEEVTNKEALVRGKETRNRKHVLIHDNFLHDIIEGKMMGKATSGRKKMELLHDMMERIHYRQLTDLISDHDGNRTASEKACQKPAGNNRRLKRDYYVWHNYDPRSIQLFP